MVAKSSVGEPVLKMIGYMKDPADLDYIMYDELQVDLILKSLPDPYAQFTHKLFYEVISSHSSLPQMLDNLHGEESSLDGDVTTQVIKDSPSSSRVEVKIKEKPRLTESVKG